MNRVPYRVLVVDDDPAVLESTMATLSDDHDVRGTTSPERALTMLEEGDFHVVVSDWTMPGMDGMDLVRRASGRPVAFLIMTGAVEGLLDQVPLGDRKMVGVIRKPFTAEKLLERIDVLGRIAGMKRAVAGLK